MSSSYYNLFARYLDNTEGSALLGRWAAISAAATALGRNCWINQGHSRVYPNFYILFVGSAGSRKSTAMKIARDVLRNSGYPANQFSSTHTSRQSFYDDLAAQTPAAVKEELEQDALGLSEFNAADWAKISTHKYVFSDELVQFLGRSNADFCSSFCDMWDYNGIYEYKARHSKSVRIVNPHINLFGGLTHDHFQDCFPERVWQQGFGSRTILIHAGERRQRLFNPPPPNQDLGASLSEILKGLRTTVYGEVTYSPAALKVASEIYLSEEEYLPRDVRLQGYNSRRNSQLVKLMMLNVALDGRYVIERDDVILANSILSFAESRMSNALGQYGFAKNSEAAHQVAEVISHSDKPLDRLAIFKATASYFSKIDDLTEVLTKLVAASKISEQAVVVNSVKSHVYVPNKLDHRLLTSPYVDLRLLEEASSL